MSNNNYPDWAERLTGTSGEHYSIRKTMHVLQTLLLIYNQHKKHSNENNHSIWHFEAVLFLGVG